MVVVYEKDNLKKKIRLLWLCLLLHLQESIVPMSELPVRTSWGRTCGVITAQKVITQFDYAVFKLR